MNAVFGYSDAIQNNNIFAFMGRERTLRWISHSFKCFKTESRNNLRFSVLVESYVIKTMLHMIEMNIEMISNFFLDPEYVEMKNSPLIGHYVEILDDRYNESENMLNTCVNLLTKSILKYYCFEWLTRQREVIIDNDLSRHFVYVCVLSQTLAINYRDIVEHFYFDFDADLSCELDEYDYLDIRKRCLFTRIKIELITKWYDMFRTEEDEHFSVTFGNYFGVLVGRYIDEYIEHNKNVELKVRALGEVSCLGDYPDILDCVLRYAYI